MKKQVKNEYLSPSISEIDLRFAEAFAASPLDDYHADNDGDEGWDEEEN